MLVIFTALTLGTVKMKTDGKESTEKTAVMIVGGVSASPHQFQWQAYIEGNGRERLEVGGHATYQSVPWAT